MFIFYYFAEKQTTSACGVGKKDISLRFVKEKDDNSLGSYSVCACFFYSQHRKTSKNWFLSVPFLRFFLFYADLLPAPFPPARQIAVKIIWSLFAQSKSPKSEKKFLNRTYCFSPSFLCTFALFPFFTIFGCEIFRFLSYSSCTRPFKRVRGP